MPIQRARPKFSDIKNVSIAASTMPAGSIIQTVVQQEDGTTLLGLDSSGLWATVLGSVCKRQRAALAALEARLRAIEQAIENA